MNTQLPSEDQADRSGESATPPSTDLAAQINDAAAQLSDRLVALRRDLHAHPELARGEHRTTDVVAQMLTEAGLAPRRLRGTGLVCDIGEVGPGANSAIGLRADLDALPIQESTGLPFASRTAGVSHACGHDVHTTALVGAGLVLAQLAERELLRRPVRLIFQPAEEVTPGGALDALDQGVLESVSAVYALHCDPRFDVGTIGSRIGPITSASDQVTVRLSSAGGHTSRPHLTGDLVYAMGEVITRVPAILGRRLDPRSGVNLTWGSAQAGNAHNAIPSTGVLKGTLRCLDARAWERAGEVLHEAVALVVEPYDVRVEVDHARGVPPVVNEEDATMHLEAAARAVLGPDAVALTEQSLGGEDFAWFLHHVPGALGRLGTRTPGGRLYDIHQGDLVVDERAIGVGVRVLCAVATL